MTRLYAADAPVDISAALPARCSPIKGVRVCVLSDTHGIHRTLTLPPGVDVLVCCGDFSEDGTPEQCADFLEWFAAQPAAHRLLICGNHELELVERANHDAEVLRSKLSADGRVTYLQDSAVEVAGLRVYGTPWMARPRGETYDHNAFCLDEDAEALRARYAAIPSGLDLLLTHTPPKGARDTHGLGSSTLAAEVARAQPVVHCFGHVHSGYGHVLRDEVLYVNAAVDATAPEPVVFFTLTSVSEGVSAL
jgi:Icc-related predicted phosphoesterase